MTVCDAFLSDLWWLVPVCLITVAVLEGLKALVLWLLGR
jgi:hypothetical protein